MIHIPLLFVLATEAKKVCSEEFRLFLLNLNAAHTILVKFPVLNGSLLENCMCHLIILFSVL